MMRNEPLTWVGVGRFELPASSSRTTANPQVRYVASCLTWRFISHCATALHIAIAAPDAPVTHGASAAAAFPHAPMKISTA